MMKDPYNRWSITGPGIPPGQMELQVIAYNNLKQVLDNTRKVLATKKREYAACREDRDSKAKSIAILKATIRELIRDD